MSNHGTTAPVIDVRALRKTFGRAGSGRDVDAVRNLTFSVEPGARLAFIGPNGAGKSTSIKMLTGILRPTSGDATVLGFVPWKERRRLAHRIGTLFGQRSQLWYQLTPARTYDLLGRIYGLDSGEKRRRLAELGELLDATSLFERPVRTLSLGERMRCELVASLLHQPDVLFLDEPTIGLDLVAKARFRDLILRINEERGTTVFLTSHDVSDIEQVARRVIVVNHGTIIYDDSGARLRRTLLHTKMVDVRFEEDPGTVEIAGAVITKQTGAGLKLEVDTATVPIRRVLDQLLDAYHVADISVSDPPLDEIVAHIYTSAAP